MQKVAQEDKMLKIASFDGINVYRIKSEKFKTSTINIFFHDSLNKENAAKNALIPAVLKRGCERFPTFKDISLYLEELYGAIFDYAVGKKGEQQIIQFYMECVSDKYAEEDADLFKKAFGLLYEIITKPVLADGAFKNEYVEQEKENLKNLIESRINDKVQYAVEKCLEEMCKNEPFGTYEFGDVCDLPEINSNNLYKHYRRFLETLPISVFVTGNIGDDKLNWIIGRLSGIRGGARGAIKSMDMPDVSTQVIKVKNITEKMNVNQGKLSIGFRTGTPSYSKDYYSLMVYNGILGGGMHSKLFENVREKASMAYYAFSRLEKFKGLMIISSGIEIQNKERVLEIVLKQLDEIRAGSISDYEYDSTVKAIETGIKSLKDSQRQIVDFHLGQIIANTNDSFEDIIEKVGKITKSDVVNISQKIKMDTVYFLTSGG